MCHDYRAPGQEGAQNCDAFVTRRDTLHFKTYIITHSENCTTKATVLQKGLISLQYCEERTILLAQSEVGLEKYSVLIRRS